MANVRITQLPAAPSPITGSELVPIVQNGQTVQTTVYNLVNSPTQTQTYLTINNEPSLPNSQRLVGGLGLGTSSGGSQGQYTISLNGASGTLENASLGIIVKNTSTSVINRSISITGFGLSITNASGVSGNPTLGLNGLPLALASLGGTGFISSDGTTLSTNVLTGITNQISISGGDGLSTPTFSIANNAILPGTGSITIPNGTTAQRVGSYGAMRYNTSSGTFEGYIATGWQSFSLTGGVTTFQTSLSGLTPSSATGGVVTLAGTLNPSSGGTGATTLTGYVIGNGTSSFTASATIPTTALSGTITNAQLANSSITINSNTVSLGGSVNVGTITSVTGTAPIQSSGGNTPAISITQASASTNGYLSSTDWNTFNNKQASGSYVTSVGATSPVSSSGGTTPTISMSVATASTNGYLSSSDWNTFNNKGSGSVTSVSGTGSVNGITLTGTVTTSGNIVLGGALSNVTNAQLQNSSITINSTAINLGASGTITANTPNALTIGTGLSGTSFNGSSAVTIAIASTTVTASSYGSATQSGTFTVNAQGQLTAASNVTITPAITSVTGLGTGVSTALAVNTGTSGAFVVNGSALGTPSSGTLSSCVGLPISTGVSGLGTGVATALGTNIGSSGAFVVYGGALGTPSSGTVTNLTGTASININGTVGATTPTTGAFTTVVATSGISGGGF